MTTHPLPAHDAVPTQHRVTPVDADCTPPYPETTPPHDALLLPAVYDLIEPYIAAARAHGPTPPARSDEWLDAHPDQQLATLLTLGVAWLISDPHLTVRALLKQASTAVHHGMGGEAGVRRWRENHIPADELDRRRAHQDPAA